jgi:hypothetical protein
VFSFFFNEKDTLYIQKDIRMYKAKVADKPRENKSYADESSNPYKSKVKSCQSETIPDPMEGQHSKQVDQSKIDQCGRSFIAVQNMSEEPQCY